MSGESTSTLIITRRDIERAMRPADYLKAAEQAFRAAALGNAHSPHPMHLPAERGGFHAKGAWLSLDRDYVAVKINGNFPGNPAELRLPTIQGAIVLCDGGNGRVLAILDSIEVTLRRTAAASALAASLLARSDSETLLICGCGEQGHAHAKALLEVLPLKYLLLWDRDSEAAKALASELDGAVVEGLKNASLTADVIACCTSSREPYLDPAMVKSGTFIAAVGADSTEKSEIAPALMSKAKVVADVVQQCVTMGDLRHAIAAGLMTALDVHAELGEILVGARNGRQSSAEIIIFDSNGTGVQDVAAAALIYERCANQGRIRTIALGAE